MIYTSRDYTFTEELDYRFTQYRCPECNSFHVESVSISEARDASSNMAIGEGKIECQVCKFMGKGYSFQINTQAFEKKESMKSRVKSIMKDTDDMWHYGTDMMLGHWL